MLIPWLLHYCCVYSAICIFLSVFIWLSHLLPSSIQFMPTLQRCLRLVKQFQSTVSHFPWRTSLKKGNLKFVSFKDHVEEGCWETGFGSDSHTGHGLLLQTKDLCTALHILESPSWDPNPPWDSSIGQALPGTKAFHLVWLQLSLRSGQTWPRMQGQLRNQNELCQLWDTGHQLLIIVIPSYHLKLGIWNNLIYACCPGTIINRIFIHSEIPSNLGCKTTLILPDHVSSRIYVFYSFNSGHILFHDFQICILAPIFPSCFFPLSSGIHSIVK